MTKFAFVSAERANHAVSTLCRVVGASVSGFYAWLDLDSDGPISASDAA